MKGVPTSQEEIEDILVLYIQGVGVTEISKQTGIPIRTVYNNLKRVDVVKRLQDEATYMKTQTRAMLMRDATNYVNNLKDIANKSTDIRSKLKANEVLLAYLIGSPTANVDVTVSETTDNIDNAKDLLKKYRTTGSDTTEDIEE
ncbi:helix-turn-helix domain-containing protein [Clostridium sp. CF012]|uniref:helix-turn-helix domain-containing protein n=1 Tax=Clostridium sp. CF012 TaxID=2843319 RepID=UPI001C0AD209|nr:helix-turn-helix domain-containing protein [Clostridium sp. CF012]MBU3142221.1 helix-turn-helix domain-containing protein [Clostridium sp. CF012]